MNNLPLFEVRIGKRGAPRLSFATEAASSGDAVDQFLALAEEGERVEAWAVGAKPQAAIAFPVAVARNELAQAELRAAIPEAERAASDLRYLATQKARMAQREREAAELERGYHSRAGWLV